eukprot:12224814-Alexandrium_andersonii.AAC.1
MPRLSLTQMDMCWSATTPKGRGKGAAEMGQGAMQHLGDMAVGASGPSPAPSDGRPPPASS